MIPRFRMKQLHRGEYTNYRGETRWRWFVPVELWTGSTEWHPEPQLLIKAYDVDKKAIRDFAVKSFRPGTVESMIKEVHSKPIPISYELAKFGDSDRIVIDLALQEDGTKLWAARFNGWALSRDGSWDYESRPSSRPDDWSQTHRFSTLDGAIEAAHRALPQLFRKYGYLWDEREEIAEDR